MNLHASSLENIVSAAQLPIAEVWSKTDTSIESYEQIEILERSLFVWFCYRGIAHMNART